MSERDELERGRALALIDAITYAVAHQLHATLDAVDHVPNINFARKRLKDALAQLPAVERA